MKCTFMSLTFSGKDRINITRGILIIEEHVLRRHLMSREDELQSGPQKQIYDMMQSTLSNC